MHAAFINIKIKYFVSEIGINFHKELKLNFNITTTKNIAKESYEFEFKQIIQWQLQWNKFW